MHDFLIWLRTGFNSADINRPYWNIIYQPASLLALLLGLSPPPLSPLLLPAPSPLLETESSRSRRECGIGGGANACF